MSFGIMFSQFLAKQKPLDHNHTANTLWLLSQLSILCLMTIFGIGD